ncbi:hypothetical protein GCM10009555_040100 [Acrocarpospora macrocephala]|uniref:TIR domain-containing protein n=1 Tax=Acrocarpospora macrocephala TaxID=150177 RepID=A0A5M3WL62_9ACTN|nr:TIR domain-containing protein [Acrocarpospora macrocephala]GES10017.1 hypothetical protein Amac_036140 [Acrocarpospora macrocephala]
MIPHSSAIFDFDVALSYAGEDRAYVQQIADRLQERNVRIFYDEYAQADLWGSDLYVLLDEVYRKRARFVMAFVSRHYVSKPWTQHERQSAQARALTEAGAYFLPVRLDDSELPGLRPTMAYVDARHTSIERLIDLIEQKLSTAPGVTDPQPVVLRVPRTPDQQRELLAHRPVAWEYLLYAGVLWQHREALESKWRDHELQYARRTRQHLADVAAAKFLGDVMNDMAATSRAVTKVLDRRAQELAFGLPGEPGDPARIEHLGARLIGVYEEVLDLAATMRGTGVSDRMVPVLEAAAQLADQPLREIRLFIDQLVEECDRLPERLASDEAVTLTLTLELTIDDQALKTYEQEMRRAERNLGK